ncbi:MAG: hypothetical protein ACXWCM_18350 [Acidimicrobiales bacterium]
METVDRPVGQGGAGAIERRLVVASIVCAVAAVGTIAWATATKNHAFWAFALWVALTLAAGVCGVVALVRLPRSAAVRNLRRVALLGAVVAVLCATLGLAAYSSTRADDCPTDGSPCLIPASGPGQRDQTP